MFIILLKSYVTSQKHKSFHNFSFFAVSLHFKWKIQQCPTLLTQIPNAKQLSELLKHQVAASSGPSPDILKQSILLNCKQHVGLIRKEMSRFLSCHLVPSGGRKSSTKALIFRFKAYHVNLSSLPFQLFCVHQ